MQSEKLIHGSMTPISLLDKQCGFNAINTEKSEIQMQGCTRKTYRNKARMKTQKDWPTTCMENYWKRKTNDYSTSVAYNYQATHEELNILLVSLFHCFPQ